jgi:putative ABC transport system permease protein
MLRNYLVIALRNLRKQKLYSFINIFGLAVGTACCLFILFSVRDELSYDRYHEHAKRIYRLGVAHQFADGSEFLNALSSAPMGPALANDFPEVEEVARVHPAPSNTMIAYEENRFYENRFYFADPAILSIFTFPLSKGNPRTALAEPGTVIVSESIARKYFGQQDPVGRILTLNGQEEYRVTGVMADVPDNSHLHFDFLASFSSLEAQMGDLLEVWYYNPFFTYALLRPEQDEEVLNEKVGALPHPYVGEELAREIPPFLQPLTDIHLYPLGNEQEAQGSITRIYVFSAIALFILLIACINFINLATARSITRAREVGLRKAIGARRGQLVRQFLCESTLFALLSVVLAVILVEVLSPFFMAITGSKALAPDYLLDPLTLGSLAGLVLLVGLVAGSYPAFALSGFRPIEAFKGSIPSTRAAFWSRRVMVVLQFSISTALIISTVIAYRQLQYLHTRELGLNKEQVVVVPVRDEQVLKQQEIFKAALRQRPSVHEVTFSAQPPGSGAPGTIIWRPQPRVATQETFEVKVFQVDPDFAGTLSIELAAGRFFSSQMTTDSTAAIVLNEMAARQLGWASPDEAVGQTVSYFQGGNRMGTVIGVVQDFNFQPLHYEMQSLMILQSPEAYRYALVRIAPTDVDNSLADLQAVWSQFSAWPLSYSFLDEDFDALYRAEQRLGSMIAVFGGIAILVASLGLFGLASFSTSQRTKEIGIRKVLGASVSSIVTLLSKDFVRLVLIAVVIATPIAYFSMQRWLDDFAYRIEIGPGIFALAGVLALLIALATVSYQAIKAALADPVKSLRYE